MKYELGSGYLTEDSRKELVDYYRWIVTLATFVLTVSLSVMALVADSIRFRWLLVLGWALLGLCIFLNWLLVKGLVTLPIVLSVDEESKGKLHDLFLSKLGRRLSIYGTLQNGLFLLGVLAIGLGLALNV